MASMVLHPRWLLGSHALRVVTDVPEGLLRQSSTLDRHNRSDQEFNLSSAGYGHHAGAEGPRLVRLRAWLPNRSPDNRPIPRHRLLGDREGVEARCSV